MDISQIAVQNPWWSRREAIAEDLKIRELRAAAIQWRPRIIKYMPLSRDVVYSVRGPRQVGKTTLVKMLIGDLLEQRTNSIDILYYACDMLRASLQLYDLLETYYTWNRKLSRGRVRIFLDEISAVPEWQSAIKRFVDQYGNAGITFCLTSSHALDIERSMERLPGRTGEREGISTHKILLPMKFAEYAELRLPKIYAKVKALQLDREPTRSRDFLMLARGQAPASLQSLLPLVPQLDALLDEYLLTGGIMLAVNSFAQAQQIPQTVYELYVRQLLGDISRVGREERTAKQIIASLISRIGSRASWLNIARENGIPSPPTVPQYVGILQGMFILEVFYRIDERLLPKGASEKKVHIANPFIFHALRSWALNPAGDSFQASVEFLGSAERKSKLVEGVVGDHLARVAFNLQPTDLFDVSSRVFYWRTAKGRELDFVLKSGGQAYAFDVTYRNQIAAQEYVALKRFGKGCMISKQHFAVSPSTVTVPVSIFLMYI